MNDNREIFALVNFIEITRECRRQLVEDVLSGNPDLFRFLYEDKNKNVQLLYKKRYELKWLEAHWLKCKALFDDSEIPLATRREILKIFLKWYQKFVEAWGYESSRAFFFNAEIESLGVLIDTNQKWTAQLAQLEMSFLRETKLLDKEIEEAKRL
ncbi:MAG: hypothetical protein IJL14_05375 [Selenomonadaceae bacterium]|nr:hypothetical protein [Selenomonadaceae bacterium]